MVAVGWGEDAHLQGESSGSEPELWFFCWHRWSQPGEPLAPFPWQWDTVTVGEQQEQPQTCRWKSVPVSPTCLRSSTEPGRSSLCLSSSSRRCTVPCISPGDKEGTQTWGVMAKTPSLTTATPTRRVPEHGTGVDVGPGQGLDHHSHAGDLVLWELPQCCLHTKTLVTPMSPGARLQSALARTPPHIDA